MEIYMSAWDLSTNYHPVTSASFYLPSKAIRLAQIQEEIDSNSIVTGIYKDIGKELGPILQPIYHNSSSFLRIPYTNPNGKFLLTLPSKYYWNPFTYHPSLPLFTLKSPFFAPDFLLSILPASVRSHLSIQNMKSDHTTDQIKIFE